MNETKPDDQLLEMPQPFDVLRLIEKWRALNLLAASDGDVDSALDSFKSELVAYVTFGVTRTPASLWRVRRSSETITATRGLWEPPESNAQRNRCNKQGCPVLYVSEHIDTPFAELNVRENEMVYLIKYRPRRSLKLRRIIGKGMFLEDSQGRRLCSDEGQLSYQILREFIRSEFTRPSFPGVSYYHKISASICRVWAQLNDDQDGWQYPSIANAEYNNLALLPASARSKLDIEGAWKVVRLSQESVEKQHPSLWQKYRFLHHPGLFIEYIDEGSVEGNAVTWSPKKGLLYST